MSDDKFTETRADDRTVLASAGSANGREYGEEITNLGRKLHDLRRARPMRLEELSRHLSLEVQTAPEKLHVEVTGGYAADLLSCVMAKAQEGNLWVTLQAHPNIVAVASLLNLAGIIVTEGMALDGTTVEKANEEGVPILTTGYTTFTVVGRLFDLGVLGVD